ncbi:MAG: hypothetical protein M5R40_09435 [Anaerolineae bacterium]|nr:hypothetical protein [Anaerolineae bacterium]
MREAIEELRTASEETRIDKMGKVGMALMRYFSYVGDTAAFINILIFLAQFAHQFR